MADAGRLFFPWLLLFCRRLRATHDIGERGVFQNLSGGIAHIEEYLIKSAVPVVAID